MIADVYLNDNYGNPMANSQWTKLGDTVKIRHVYEWEYSNAETGEIIPKEKIKSYTGEINVKEKDYQDVCYEVVACVLVKNAMSYRYWGTHQFMLTVDVYQKISRNSDVMAYLFNTAEMDNAHTRQSGQQHILVFHLPLYAAAAAGCNSYVCNTGNSPAIVKL